MDSKASHVIPSLNWLNIFHPKAHISPLSLSSISFIYLLNHPTKNHPTNPTQLSPLFHHHHPQIIKSSKMDVVDSSLEAAAAFNLLNLAPLLTNLWACLAVLTAALSFWRLRPTTTTTTPPIQPPTISPKTTSVVKRTPSFEKREEEGVLTRGNSSKELFTAVYNENMEEEEERENEEDEVDGGDESVVKKWTVEIRGAGDLGWYCYQDRTVIGGNVVKLWDEERENTSPKSCRRRSSVLASSLVFT